MSHINYGLLLWGTKVYELEHQQKKAVRTIKNNQPLAHSEPLLKNLRLLNEILYSSTIYVVWNEYKKSTFSKIRVAFNNAYRKIFGVPKRSRASAMYATHNICNFESMLRKNIYGFMQRLEHSTNTIIRNLYQSWIVRCDIWSSWIKSLYLM